MKLHQLIALVSVAMSLAAAPAALASPSHVGNSVDTPTMNVCLASIDCTYVNFHNGKPSDVAKHGGRIVDWSVNAGSTGGQVQLTVLRPSGQGRFKAIGQSALETVAAIGANDYTTSLKVRRGDVLGLRNSTSGIYMAVAPAGTCVRYFNAPLNIGASGKPNRIVPQLHLLLSADVSP
jgi:hypothetical protein